VVLVYLVPYRRVILDTGDQGFLVQLSLQLAVGGRRTLEVEPGIDHSFNY
jgi:hypothetical protein